MITRIVVADDHPAARAGMSLAAVSGGCGQIVAEASNGAELMLAVEKHAPDVAVVDLNMDTPGAIDGFPLVAALRRKHPRTRVVVMTMADGPDLISALVSLGVRAIVSKRDAINEFVEAVRRSAGQSAYLSSSFQYDRIAPQLHIPSERLTTAEVEVLRQLSIHLSMTEIADRRSRSITTISRQKASAMKKLGLSNSRELHDYLNSLRGCVGVERRAP
ncbi:response regulator transcription factor [Stenotrophomonas maltophilia]|nr:response regulator transcription factor [Stenotrophomonas maltophilia]